MEIKVTETEYCKLNVHCVATKEEIDNKRNEVLKSFKKASVPGFRQGKETIEAIKIHYRSQINDSLKRALSEESFHETLFSKNIKPFGAPNFTDVMLLDEKFSCSFSMHKKPDFDLSEYKGYRIPTQPPAQSIEDMTQLMLQELRVRNGETNPYSDEDAIQMGDNVVVDYKAFKKKEDGTEEVLEAVSGSGESLVVGKIGLPGFDENLLGMKVDETKSFTILIPAGGLPSLVGQNIRFELTLIMGSKTTPMPLNDALAVKVGLENYGQLVEAVSQNATARYGEANRAAYIRQISARLLADNTFQIPTWLSLQEAQYLAANAKLSWDTMPNVDKERFLQTAEANVKMALILDKVRDNEPEAQLSDQEVIEMIRSMTNKSGGAESADQVLSRLNQSGQLSVFAARLRDEHALDFILKHSIIGEVQVNEAMLEIKETESEKNNE